MCHAEKRSLFPWLWDVQFQRRENFYICQVLHFTFDMKGSPACYELDHQDREGCLPGVGMEVDRQEVGGRLTARRRGGG